MLDDLLKLKGRVALITGGTRGIGWSTACTLAEHGADVIITGVSDQVAIDERVSHLINHYGTNCSGMLVDVSDHEAVKKSYSHIFKKYKRLDILVNNAGIMQNSLIPMTRPELIQKTNETNINGSLYNLQYASRLMSRNSWGSIINISSIVGRFGFEGQTVYAGSKSAIFGMTLSAAKELGPQNIRVNCIAPGFIETDLISGFSVEKKEEVINSTSLKRIGSPKDIAACVLFLTSEMSSYISGQIIGIDGGMSL